jgi:hypothetical protein
VASREKLLRASPPGGSVTNIDDGCRGPARRPICCC